MSNMLWQVMSAGMDPCPAKVNTTSQPNKTTHSHVLDGTIWDSDIMCLGAEHHPVLHKGQLLFAPAAQHGQGVSQAAPLLGTDCKQRVLQDQVLKDAQMTCSNLSCQCSR